MLKAIFAPLVVLAAASTDGMDSCRRLGADYEAAAAAIDETLSVYRKCVATSLRRDPCSAEFEDVDVAQDRFETVVADYKKRCSMPMPRRDR